MDLLTKLGLLVLFVTLTTANKITTNVYPCPDAGFSRIPHSWSCSKFVQCVNGAAVEQDCARGLFYSAEHQYCTSPANANCDIEESPCPRWTEPEDLVVLGDGESCSQYYMCFDGEPTAFQCAPGLNFNGETNQCDEETCSAPSLSCNGTANEIFPDAGDCSRFHQCFNEVLYSGRCRNGMLFDTITSRCVPSEDAACSSVVTTTQSPTSTTTSEPEFNLNDLCRIDVVGNIAVLEHPDRCDWYIGCTLGRATIGRCDWQTIFNIGRERCVPGDRDTCEFFDVTTTLPDWWTPVTGGPDFNVNDFCIVEIVGNTAVVPHPQRCDWYITCILGRGTVDRCGWMHIFNDYIGRCLPGDPDTCELANGDLHGQ